MTKAGAEPNLGVHTQEKKNHVVVLACEHRRSACMPHGTGWEGTAAGPGTRRQLTQDAWQLLHHVTDEQIQAPGQVLVAAVLLLAWRGLPAVSLDVHHQSTHRQSAKITSHDKTRRATTEASVSRGHGPRHADI